MAPDTSSTLTSTSHTLTALPTMAQNTSTVSNGKPAVLLERLQPASRHLFIQPSADLPTESLNLAKDTLEDFAGQIAEDQQERLRESRKRKRGGDKEEVLKIRKVYVDGFETNQVWQQAKRIIAGVMRHKETVLKELQESNGISSAGVPEMEHTESDDDSLGDAVEDSESNESDESDVGTGYADEEAASVDGVVPAHDESSDEIGEDDEEEWEDAEEELVDDAEEDEEGEDDQSGDEYAEDPDGLNDGFFSLDEFNKQSQWFEEQDARGDPNTDRASDDEEINWEADPFAPTKSESKTSKRKQQDDESIPEDGDEDDEEDDGPTFGNMDLDAPEGDSDDEAMQGELAGGLEDGLDDGGFNANDVYYKDFFAPPKRKGKGDKPKKKAAPQTSVPDDGEVDRAMADVRRDLFDDESDAEDTDDALSDASAGDPKSRRSAHERRQAKIAEEIRKLEAASVAKREWAMSGEAAAADRPMNSLLEEDLDFEHVGKPVPVITPEVSEDIEDLIKRRILAQEFDEVIRRRPGVDNVPAGTRRGLVEDVDDTKSKKGLAEVYEEEHTKKNNPDTYVSQSDERLQREEREIENMWKGVCSRLDALSSWHYKPRPVEPALSVVADTATVSMEDAQPSTAQGVSGNGAASRMAPQEVYAAGPSTAAARGEVVSRSGLPVARQEMSREDKQRRRRREKERVRKAGGAGRPALSGRARMERDTVADLKKGGVKVINRKGEVTDVEGNKVKAAKTASSGSYKL